MKYHSDETELQMVLEYVNDGRDARYLANKYGYKTHKSVLDKIRKHGYRTRSVSECKLVNKIHADFSMERIDSHFKAYLLGLLLTDGWIVRTTVGLDLTDEDAIKFISDIIGIEYSTYEREAPRKPRHRLRITNIRVMEEMARFGVVPHKSLTLQPPQLHDDEWKYLPYIVRGIIDGNGWVRNDGHEFYICSGSIDFVRWVESVLIDRLYMRDLHYKQNDNGIHFVRSSDERNIAILKLLVYDRPYGMMRKYNKVYMGDLQRL